MDNPATQLHAHADTDLDTSLLLATYEKQKEAYLNAAEPSYDQRMQDLRTLKKMLMKLVPDLAIELL